MRACADLRYLGPSGGGGKEVAEGKGGEKSEGMTGREMMMGFNPWHAKEGNVLVGEMREVGLVQSYHGIFDQKFFFTLSENCVVISYIAE